MPVSGFGVQNLGTLRQRICDKCQKTLCLSADMLFKFRNAAGLSEFGVARLETLCLSKYLMFSGWNLQADFAFRFFSPIRATNDSIEL